MYKELLNFEPDLPGLPQAIKEQGSGHYKGNDHHSSCRHANHDYHRVWHLVPIYIVLGRWWWAIAFAYTCNTANSLIAVHLQWTGAKNKISFDSSILKEL